MDLATVLRVDKAWMPKRHQWSADPLVEAGRYRWHFLAQFRARPEDEARSRHPHPYRWSRVAALAPVRLP